jgi:hypothetical protein
MLELSHGELGWDVFTLEYKIEAPLNVIVTPKCAREYLKVPPGVCGRLTDRYSTFYGA